MAKTKSVYFCQNCGFESAKWLGKCPSCNEWNTFVEETVVTSGQNKNIPLSKTGAKPVKIDEIDTISFLRIQTGISEFDRILGGGIVPGSLILIGGDPGIGKSTLSLQLALQLNKKVLYVSGEESEQQLKMRANRLGSNNNECYILSETLLENITSQIINISPELIIVDSIQTLYKETLDSSPGSVSQIRECAVALLKIAKENNIPIILISHINKDGQLAGPKVLEHIVDTVLQFEGDIHNYFRILRVLKNRFGATSELAIFEMKSDGLIEILNPSEILLNHSAEYMSGRTVAAMIDGLRPLLIETQALVSSAVYGTPQRSATGFDGRRLNMLLAVLEKRAKFNLATKDVFLNIAGGIKVNDPAIDLAVVVAVLSSGADLSINPKYCFAGEIGLSGEIRPVTRIDQRIQEAEKIGFEKIFIADFGKKGFDKKHSIEIVTVNKVSDLVQLLFKDQR